eukprot:SAG31_NODE_491_length_14923_cov_12.905221_9_plen_274_part_00
MIVLDWDDTLLPTTQLTDNYGAFITGNAALPKEVVEQLAVLQATGVKFLKECTQLGHVTVITNAMNGPHLTVSYESLQNTSPMNQLGARHHVPTDSSFHKSRLSSFSCLSSCASVTLLFAVAGWVNLSGRLFIPQVLDTLQSCGIEIIYARENCADSGDAEEWKMDAFVSLVESMSAEVPPQRMHLVSIGDSVFERHAAHYAGAEHATASIKTIKLIDPWEGPTIVQLTKQLHFLTEALRETCLQDTSVDLETSFAHGCEDQVTFVRSAPMST